MFLKATMHAKTPFQHLPHHIIQLIVNHVVGSSRILSDDIESNPRVYLNLLKPLLWICHNFRIVAYSRYCGRFKMHISMARPRAYGDRYNAYLGYPTFHLFKILVIEINETSIYSGTALQKLSLLPHDSCSFPKVRKLFILLGMDRTSGYYMDRSPEGKENVSASVQWIKEMAPMVSSINVEPRNTPASSHPNFNYLISQLFQLATHVAYSKVDYSLVLVNLQLNDIRDLVHIKYTAAVNADQFMHLARQNAPTLQSLRLRYSQRFDIADLIRNADGCYATYPCLQTLKLWKVASHNDTTQSVSPGIVPFPDLRHLLLARDYPFGDDILFRGNAALLESLDMQLNRLTVNMLCKYRVFTPTSHPKLKYVKVSFWQGIFTATAEEFRFELSVGIQAPVRRINGSIPGAGLAPAFLSVGNYAYIQILILPSLNLQLLDALVIIRSLQLLSDLHAGYPILGITPPGIALDDLPAYVVSTHVSMSERFRCWNVGECDLRKREEADPTKCMLILALVCPRFTYSFSPSYAREKFKTELEDTIALDMFTDYAPRLRHILLHDWKNC